jgi:hypothetical protein
MKPALFWILLLASHAFLQLTGVQFLVFLDHMVGTLKPEVGIPPLHTRRGSEGIARRAMGASALFDLIFK